MFLVQQQLPQIALSQRGHPFQIGKVVLAHQRVDMLGAASIMLLLARVLGRDLGCVSQALGVWSRRGYVIKRAEGSCVWFWLLVAGVEGCGTHSADTVIPLS